MVKNYLELINKLLSLGYFGSTKAPFNKEVLSFLQQKRFSSISFFDSIIIKKKRNFQLTEAVKLKCFPRNVKENEQNKNHL